MTLSSQWRVFMEWLMWVMMTLDWSLVCWGFERWDGAIPEKLCWVRLTLLRGSAIMILRVVGLICLLVMVPLRVLNCTGKCNTESVIHVLTHTCIKSCSPPVCVCVCAHERLPGALAPLTTCCPIMLDRGLVERSCCHCLCYTVWLPGSPLGTGNDKAHTQNCLPFLVNISHLLWQVEVDQALRKDCKLFMCVCCTCMACCVVMCISKCG